MDNDERRELGLLICFPLVGCLVSWWLSILSSCSQWVAPYGTIYHGPFSLA